MAEEIQAIPAHGWKTYLAGAAAIIGGATLILVNNQFEAGFASVIAGLTILGVGGKLARLITLLKVIADKPKS